MPRSTEKQRVVQVYIPTYEPATMCWGSVAIITEATRELVGSGWRLRINEQGMPARVKVVSSRQ